MHSTPGNPHRCQDTPIAPTRGCVKSMQLELCSNRQGCPCSTRQQQKRCNSSCTVIAKERKTLRSIRQHQETPIVKSMLPQRKTTPRNPECEVYAVPDKALKRFRTISQAVEAVAPPPRLSLNSATKPTKFSSAYAQNSSGEPKISTWYWHNSHIMWNLGFNRQLAWTSPEPSPREAYIKHSR